MNRKQLIAIGALPVLAVSMTAIYRGLARLLGRKLAWYAGFLVYWPVWCVLFPLRMVGFQKLRALFRDRRPDAPGWFMIVFPPALALVGGVFQDKRPLGKKERVAQVFMAFVNGTLEEVLWRGVYITSFPDQPLWSAVWPTLWFAVWHYAPGSVSPLTDVGTLMAGAGVYGAGLSWLALRRRSIRWPVTSHTLAGLVHVLN